MLYIIIVCSLHKEMISFSEEMCAQCSVTMVLMRYFFFNEKLIKRLIVVPSENVCVLNIMNIKNSGQLMYGLNQN